jgi:predicted metal-dependent HD superfamily phosphohydrolase
VVYEPRASDCEERSARALVTDADVLGIPREAAASAADLVRATAHASGRSEHSAAADLVVDDPGKSLTRNVDLSILGRDVLRFMDYEYSVEEEYSPLSTVRFVVGRGRFLASLLDRPRIFRTEHFRRRYEQRARTQIAALLASPRYRCYRWLRWMPGRSPGPRPVALPHARIASPR